MFVVAFLFLLFTQTRCHCPHMAKMAAPEGPAPPAHLPEGDKGWDWDEEAAPGSTPNDHFIQTSLIQKTLNEEESAFAKKLESTLKKLQDVLRKEARVTVDNENIDCSIDSTHYRCSDFPPSGSYHFLVVEDSSNGAAVYSIDRKYNQRSDGAVEMALLDALSRHSPSSLTVYASKEAEKEVGFVRRLSVKELQSLTTTRQSLPPPRRSPIELRLFEPKVLELRSTAGMEEVSDSRLVTFSSQEQFDAALKVTDQLAVLFWNNVDAVSVHVFYAWARLSAKKGSRNEKMIMAQVECHKHVAFCTGLGPRDFRTVVAYRGGQNVATTEHIGDDEYYEKWMTLALTGPVVKLSSDEDVSSAKRGLLPISSLTFPSLTIATFPSDSSASFKHFKIAAERLIGRYALAYRIREGATESVSTYRPSEKRRRVDYEGRYDPASLMSFIASSAAPSMIDISSGFSTDALFHQPLSIALLVAPSDFDVSVIEKTISLEEVRKSALFAKLDSSSPMKVDIFKRINVETEEPVLILFKKARVDHHVIQENHSPEEIGRWIRENMPQGTLSVKEIHPLRLLQIHQANEYFGKQEILLLPDHTLFKDTMEDHPEVSAPISGGCPFMSGGGAATLNHDEL